ncbi:hypothetical protein PR003_g10524 [Phytophthora rubi]|nr:hypothetical protein PR003_g10524 [Phytophthora rubi]
MHWIDEDWNLRYIILGFRRVEYPHTGVRLADDLLDVIKAMDGALFATLWAITTDNAQNNKTMVRSFRPKLPDAVRDHLSDAIPPSAADMTSESGSAIEAPQNVFQVRCLAHVLQLAVKEGLTVRSFVDTCIGTIRDILRKLVESTALNEELERICKVLEVKFEQPVLNCVTRWNSTWSMVISAIHLRKSIEELLRRIHGRHEGYRNFSIGPDERLAAPLVDSKWQALEVFCTFLTPVKVATMMLSGKNCPTFGMAVVVFELVSKNATSMINQAVARYTADFATAFNKKIDKYDSLVKYRGAQIAAMLDPRAKTLLPKVMTDIGPIRQYVIDEYEAEYRVRFESQQQGTSASTLNQQDTEEVALGKVLHQMLDDNFGLDEPTGFDGGESFASELDRFWIVHRDPTMNSKTSSSAVCAWMRTLDQFPRIRMMTRDFLSVMATSVPSEQAFSAAGATVSVR